MVQDRVQQITKELTNDFSEKLKVYKEQEHSLQKQLNHIKDQFTSLQSNQEFTLATTNHSIAYGIFN
jgi:homeobox protein cut-like